MFDAETIFVLKFRCAQTARRFLVVFARQDVSLRFTVVKVVDEQDFTLEEACYFEQENPTQQLESMFHNLWTSAVKLIAGTANLTNQLLLRPNIQDRRASQSDRSFTNQQKPFSQFKQGGNHFNIADFDFTGWYCPCCGYAKDTKVQVQFVKCGRCHDYICGSRIEHTSDGSQLFACHSQCGHKSVLSNGKLSSLSGISGYQTKPVLIDNRSTVSKLPLSRPSLPSKKRG